MKKYLILANLILLFSASLWFSQAQSVRAAFGLNPKIKQVRTANNPAVYYLDHKLGMKKAYINEKAFFSYDNHWASVQVISQENLAKWSDIHLVKTKKSPAVYYINNGFKAVITSEQQFLDNGFKWAEVAVISEADLNEYKTADFNTIKAATAPSSAPSANTASTLTISLSPVTTGQYIPTGSRNITMAAFRLAAGGQDVRITNLSFTQQGVTSDNVIESAYLTDEAGTVYGDKYGLTNKHFYLNLARQPLVIPAGQAKTLYLKADLNATSGVTGQTLKFGLLDASDLTADSAVSAAFPLSGQEFRLADGISNLGRIRANEIILNSAPVKANIGVNAKAIYSFRLSEISGNEDVLIKKITLTNNGSARDQDLANVILIDQNGKTVMKVNAMSDKKLTFILEPGYLIRKYHYVNFTLKADIVSGDSRDIKFVVAGDGDIVAVGQNADYNLAIVNNANVSGSINRFIIARSPIFLTAAKVKASDLIIYNDQDNAALGQFELTNSPTDIKIYSLNLTLAKSAPAPVLDQPIVALDAKTGQQLGTIDAAKITNSFGEMFLSNLPINKGKSLKIVFQGHIPDTAKSGDTYQLKIKSLTYHIAQDNIAYSDNLEVNGQRMQVISPAIFIYAGAKTDRDTAVAGQEKVIVGFFKIEATDDSAVKITSLTFTNASGYTAVNSANGFTNLAVYRGSSRLSDIIAQPNENSYTFDGLKTTISAGTAADIYLKADLAENAKGKVKLFLENADGYDSSGKIPIDINNKNITSPEVEITATTLAVSAISGGTATPGQKNNQIASFNLINQSAEKVRLSYIILNSSASFTGNLSANNGYYYLRFAYLNTKNQLISAGYRLANPVADSNEISLSGLTLNPNESLNLILLVDLDATAARGLLNLSIRDIVAKGYASGVTAGVSGAPTTLVAVTIN